MSKSLFPHGRVASKDGLPVTSTSYPSNKEALDVNLMGGNVFIDNAIIDVSLDSDTDSVTVVGEVNVNNFPASQNVVVTNFPAESDPQNIVGTVSVNNFPSTINIGNFPASQNVVVTSIPEVEIKNDSGNAVPISAASLPLPSGAAAEATLQDLLFQLDEIRNSVSVLGQARGSSADVRTNVTGGSLTTVSTVTSVTNLVSFMSQGILNYLLLMGASDIVKTNIENVKVS